MRIFWITLAGAVGLAASALAQDAPPPGCRWQDGGATLACKDGKGYWRRSGDGEIVGRYAMPRPKPKPAPKPVAQAVPIAAPATEAVAVAPAAPALADQQGADRAEVLPPAPPQAEAAPPVEAAPVPVAAEQPSPAPVEPWWKRMLNSIWNGILAFLRLVGLLR